MVHFLLERILLRDNLNFRLKNYLVQMLNLLHVASNTLLLLQQNDIAENINCQIIINLVYIPTRLLNKHYAIPDVKTKCKCTNNAFVNNKKTRGVHKLMKKYSYTQNGTKF